MNHFGREHVLLCDDAVGFEASAGLAVSARVHVAQTSLRPALPLERSGAALTDRYGLRHTTDNPLAVQAFERAVHGVAAHRPAAGEALGQALACDSHLAAAHALKGL